MLENAANFITLLLKVTEFDDDNNRIPTLEPQSKPIKTFKNDLTNDNIKLLTHGSQNNLFNILGDIPEDFAQSDFPITTPLEFDNPEKFQILSFPNSNVHLQVNPNRNSSNSNDNTPTNNDRLFQFDYNFTGIVDLNTIENENQLSESNHSKDAVDYNHNQTVYPDHRIYEVNDLDFNENIKVHTPQESCLLESVKKNVGYSNYNLSFFEINLNNFPSQKSLEGLNEVEIMYLDYYRTCVSETVSNLPKKSNFFLSLYLQ